MPSTEPTAQAPARYLRAMLSLVLIVGILYVAKPVIVPLSLAVLFAFVLTPLVVAVQRRGLGRVPAVLTVVLFTLVLLGAVAWGVGAQLTNLAEDLPNHKTQIQAKITRLRGSGAGPWSRLMDTARAVTEDAQHPKPATQPAAAVGPEKSSFEQLIGVAVMVLEPLADAGLILILVIFMLIRREDLRNRVIGLLGHGRLTGTTRVLVGSAERLSKLLFMQLCVNAAFGTVFGLSLMLMHVPYWFLWGFLTVLLRFIPYVGSWMAAALPILLSFAISPGWGQPILVLAVFFSLDLVTANVIEPLLFGHSTGVSPMALLVAAAFWTWVWGPIGLVLATPLTVCLVVLGQHAPKLKFLTLLLGDQPALEPSVSYYQRLLAGDKAEASALAVEFIKAHEIATLPDVVLMPAVRLARRDRAASGLTAADETFILEATEQIVTELTPPEAQLPTDPLVLGCAAHHKSEEIAVRMIGATLKAGEPRVEPISTRALPAEIEARIEKDKPIALMIAVVPPGGLDQTRYLCRRLRRKFADLPIVVVYFGKSKNFDRLLVRLRASGASYVTTSVAQTRQQILATIRPVAAATPEPAAV